MKKIKLTTEDKIHFTPHTKKYGCAEFQVCPIMKYGKLKRLLIYPRQQPDKRGTYYEVEFSGQDSLMIHTWLHKGYTHPNIWLMFWCKEHKCMSYNIYCDKKLNCIEFSAMSGASMRFVNTND